MVDSETATSSLTFEKVTLGAGETLVELIEQYYNFDGLHFNKEEIGRGLPLLLSESVYGVAFFAYIDRELAGYFILTFGFDLEFGGRLATLTDLFLRPEYRGKGYGSKVLSFVETFCRENEIFAVELQVERHNSIAHRLYRSFGFQELDRVPMCKPVNPVRSKSAAPWTC